MSLASSVIAPSDYPDIFTLIISLALDGRVMSSDFQICPCPKIEFESKK